MNVVVPKRAAKNPDEQPPSDAALDELFALCGLLNSSPAAEWFQTHAKQRGLNLDIGGTLLRECPLPDWTRPERAEVAALARRRADAPRTECGPIDAAIDAAVRAWRDGGTP